MCVFTGHTHDSRQDVETESEGSSDDEFQPVLAATKAKTNAAKAAAKAKAEAAAKAKAKPKPKAPGAIAVPAKGPPAQRP